MPEQLAFTYDPLVLTRLFLKIHMAEKYDRNKAFPKSLRFAVADFMASMSDEELEALLTEYTDTENVTEITLEQHDRERLEHYILKSDRFKKQLFDNQIGGLDGLGLADKLNKTFTPCELGEHWDTLGTVLMRDHAEYGKAFREILYNHVNEFAGITQSQVDTYIETHFVFVGGSVFTNVTIEDRRKL